MQSRRWRGLARLVRCDESPLAWALPNAEPYRAARQLIAELAWLERPAQSRRSAAGSGARSVGRGSAATLESLATDWLTRAEAAVAAPAFVLECLAWCWALPKLARQLPEPIWWQLLNRVVECAAGPAPAEPLAALLQSAELSLAVAYAFPEVAACRALAEPGRRALGRLLRDVVGPARLPPRRHMAELGLLLASATRAGLVGDALAGARAAGRNGRAAAAAERSYRTLVQAALRLSSPDGRACFGAAEAAGWDAALLTTAARLAGEDTPQLLRLVTVGRASPRLDKSLPRTAIESEAAGLAQLRCDWTAQSPVLSVSYGEQEVALDLRVGGQALLCGTWDGAVSLDGQQLEPTGQWQHTCWVSDADVDYLELFLELPQGLEIERHVLLARRDRVLLLADAVLGARRGQIEYRSGLSLAPGVQFVGERETRDGSLTIGPKPAARVLPMALGEWRAERSPGELSAANGALVHERQWSGSHLFAPLLLDFDAGRLRREATWRRLTVAEERVNVSHDVAVGYRAQSGTSQWVIYRSLAPPQIRSLLSKSLMHQFLFGVFSDAGKVEALLEIDSR
ncbi:MAG: hypothetical protein AB7O59_25075 [Pirellulales bacterium]